MTRRPPTPPLFPYTTLFRSVFRGPGSASAAQLYPPRGDRHPTPCRSSGMHPRNDPEVLCFHGRSVRGRRPGRSEEHTSELQSHVNLVCRLLLEKKKK